MSWNKNIRYKCDKGWISLSPSFSLKLFQLLRMPQWLSHSFFLSLPYICVFLFYLLYFALSFCLCLVIFISSFFLSSFLYWYFYSSLKTSFPFSFLNICLFLSNFFDCCVRLFLLAHVWVRLRKKMAKNEGGSDVGKKLEERCFQKVQHFHF